jgi:predicted HTH domain antitoxin
MPTRNVKVHIEAPAGVSPAARESAEQKARETVVLALWEAGEITTSRAAEELALSVHDFLDLLAAKGLPVVRGALNREAVETARRKLAPDRR